MYRFLFIIFLICNLSTSQSIQNKAIPKITHYDTKNMGFSSKSWDIKQDEDGLIYIANEDRILIYDGIRWESITPQTGIANRSLLVKNKDSIYFGADGHNGLLIKQGLSEYNIVSRQTDKDAVTETEEFWRAHLINDQVIFQTFKNLYINQQNFITKIQAPHRFKWSYEVNGQLYVNDLKKGVFKLENTDLIPIVSDQALNEHIVGVTAIANDLIIITDTLGLFRLQEGGLIPINFPKSEELKKAQIFSFSKLRDGRIAIGTVSNGLYLLDLLTNTMENINKENGLQNNTILSIYQDDENNLWLALDYGVDYVKLNSELKYFFDSYGKVGTTYAVMKTDGLSYLGTNQGLYIADNVKNSDVFELLLNGQVWNIEKIENQIFIGHDKGAYLADGKNLSRIGDDLGSWNFRKYKVSPEKDVIISGNYNGISLYEQSENSWKGYKLKGFEKSSQHIEIDSDNFIWVALGLEGIFQFKLNYGEKSLEKIAFYPLSDFKGGPIALSKVNDSIVVTSNFTKYTYSPQTKTFASNPLKNGIGSTPRIYSENNQVWYVDYDNIALETNGRLKAYPELRDQLLPGLKNIFSLNPTNKIIPIYNGFALHTINKKDTITPKRENVLVRSFTSVNSKNSYLQGATIPYLNNDLKIDYALPIYGEEVLYQTRINNGEWSDWSNITTRNLYNLKEGTYNFDIKATYNGTSKETTYTFSIAPPLYRTIWAYFLYFLILIIMVLAVFSYNKYKMKKQEKILLQQKAEKLKKQEELYQAQKREQERKIIELNNAKLQDEVKSKNRELTQIAYVNLNKNKILKKIRDKIVKVQESAESKLPTNNYNELIRLVDYYITDKESKLFEINFDKSHQEFYEKLSKTYPSLTSKDLRLCAYLKMNLSSKEIAPLLGISSQSVDVSRHRLRKKLNLDASDNLINSLINLK